MWCHPLRLQREHFGGDVEVGVIVHQSEPVLAGEYCAEQVGDPNGAMPAGPGEEALGVEGRVPMPIVGRYS